MTAPVDRFTVLALTAGAAAVVAGSLAYHAAFPVKVVVGIGMMTAGLLLIRAFLRTYEGAIVRAHPKVVDHPELGEVGRWAIFGVALVGYPLLLRALLFAGIAAAQAING